MKTKNRKKASKLTAEEVANKKRARMLRRQDRLFSNNGTWDRYDSGSTIEDAASASFEFKFA